MPLNLISVKLTLAKRCLYCNKKSSKNNKVTRVTIYLLEYSYRPVIRNICENCINNPDLNLVSTIKVRKVTDLVKIV